MIWMKIIWPLLNNLLIKRAQIIGDTLLPFVEEGDTILDFGCAVMLVSKHIQSKKNISLTGIDVKKYKINNANYVKYSGGRLPFNDNQFDVVIALFVLHHTDDPEFYVKEFIRVSKRKILICEDTYTNKIGEIITKLICWISNFICGDTDMKRSFKSVKEWNELFAKNNVNLVTFKRFYPHPIPCIPTKNVLIELKK